MAPPRAIVFDLDGTLLNTLEDLCNAVNRVLRTHGFPLHPVDAYRYFVGDGVRVLFERALPEAHRDEETLRTCIAEFREDYAVHWNVATRPYQGIAELLDGLTARGIPMAVLSNKPHDTTVKCITGLLGAWRFHPVFGQREGIPKKPDPAGALEIAQVLALRPETFLYVGDTGTDMLTAAAAGMQPVGALWGFRPERELREHGARVCVPAPPDILTLLD